MKTLILTLVLLIVICGASPITLASTFVGNGGNVGDIELQVTLNQISKTLSAIIEDEELGDELCGCVDAYKNDELCTHIESLTKAQVKYCSIKLKEKSK